MRKCALIHCKQCVRNHFVIFVTAKRRLRILKLAIYHCSVNIGSRSNGASSVGSCAYREGKKMEDKKLGVVHDYSKKSGVIDSFTLTPIHAPKWAKDSLELWNQVEQIEKRKDAQLFREVVVALPRELTIDKQKELITDYVTRNFVDRGMCATVAVHDTGKENPHAHIMLTTRHISKDGFEKKDRTWNDKELLKTWRYDWSQTVNNKLQRNGFEQRIDHRTLIEQGINREPQIHLGKIATAMERNGKESERGNINREIEQRNNIGISSQHVMDGINNARKQYEKYKEQEKIKAMESRIREKERIATAQREKDMKQTKELSVKPRSRGFSR